MRKIERVRVNMRLPDDLVRWAKRHSRRTGKTFTEVVAEGLRKLQSEADWHSNEVQIVEAMLKQETSNGRASVTR